MNGEHAMLGASPMTVGTLTYIGLRPVQIRGFPVFALLPVPHGRPLNSEYFNDLPVAKPGDIRLFH